MNGPGNGAFLYPGIAATAYNAPTQGGCLMAYVRLSIARPRRGEEARFEEVMRRLTEVTAQQPGCQAALR